MCPPYRESTDKYFVGPKPLIKKAAFPSINNPFSILRKKYIGCSVYVKFYQYVGMGVRVENDNSRKFLEQLHK